MESDFALNSLQKYLYYQISDVSKIIFTQEIGVCANIHTTANHNFADLC